MPAPYFFHKTRVQKSVEEADVHIQQRVKSDGILISVENINQQPAEKPYEKPFPLSSHETEGNGQHQQQIGRYGGDGQCLKDGSLQNENNQYEHCQSDFSPHL